MDGGRSFVESSPMMEPAQILLVVLLSGAFAFLLSYFMRPVGLFHGGSRSRIPRDLVVFDVPDSDVPFDARQPLKYLGEKLQTLGFERIHSTVRVPTRRYRGRHLLLVPFVHVRESALFLMGIEPGWPPRSELMLHIITPLTKSRRVETSTLPGLMEISAPSDVALNVVLDAESIEEIWSRHRRALTDFERSERTVVPESDWLTLVSSSYAAWIEAGLNARRLSPVKNKPVYRFRHS
jgi:hypothetical protein